MSNTLTVIGNLAADPELAFTPQGKAVVKFTVITSKSRKNETTGEWESSDVTSWHVSAWDSLAENVAESLHRGDAVVVVGSAAWRSWENKDGSKGGRLEVTAWNVAADLKRRPVRVLTVGNDTSSGVSESAPF